MLSFSSIIIPSLSKTKSDTTLALAIISRFDPDSITEIFCEGLIKLRLNTPTSKI